MKLSKYTRRIGSFALLFAATAASQAMPGPAVAAEPAAADYFVAKVMQPQHSGAASQAVPARVDGEDGHEFVQRALNGQWPWPSAGLASGAASAAGRSWPDVSFLSNSAR